MTTPRKRSTAPNKSTTAAANRAKPATRRKAAAPAAAPTHDAIAARAYEIYLRRGAAPGNHEDDWISAERELSAMP